MHLSGTSFVSVLVASGFCIFLNICDCSDPVASKEAFGIVETSGPSVADARETFQQANAGEEKGGAALNLVRNRTVEELNTLRLDDDNGVALCAAWRSLEIQIAGRFLGLDRSAFRMEAPRVVTSEFVGFVEGRLKVSPPDRWLANLLGVRFRVDGWPDFPVDAADLKNEGPNSPTKHVDPRRTSLPQANLILSEMDPSGRLLIRGDSNFAGKTAYIQLPDSIKKRVKAATKRSLRLCAIANEDRAIVAIQDDAFPAGSLICVPHVQSGEKEEIYWETQVDAFWFDNYKGTGIYLEMRIRDESIFVFYSHARGIGVEQFSIENGKRIFSFNSLPQVRL